MIAIKAHFDGKVIVPDEPLGLPPQQRLRVIVDPINEPSAEERLAAIEQLKGMALRAPAHPEPHLRTWLGAGDVPRPREQRRFQSDDDLW